MKSSAKLWVRKTVAVLCCGSVLAVGCGADELRAIATGIDAATQVLRDQAVDSVSFGDLLLNELRDL